MNCLKEIAEKWIDGKISSEEYVAGLVNRIDTLEYMLSEAHREGWEQAKREAINMLRYQHNIVVGEASFDYLATLEQCWNMIDTMTYKEENK